MKLSKESTQVINTALIRYQSMLKSDIRTWEASGRAEKFTSLIIRHKAELRRIAEAGKAVNS